jgi:hypothetical protein
MSQAAASANILVLFSHPLINQRGEPVPALDTQRERETLLRVLGDSRRALQVRFDIATTDNLSRGLVKGANIVHFSGHGDPNGVLFEDGRGGAHLLHDVQLRDLLAAVGGVKLAFVSACHSEPTGEALVKAGIPHVVAVETPETILDNAAIIFAREFYRYLSAGRTVQDAFDIARAFLKSDPDFRAAAETRKFLLLLRTASHGVTVFAGAAPGKVDDRSPTLASSNLPVRREDFTGRARELHNTVNAVLDRRLVTLIGPPGIGKTEVGTEAARWCLQVDRPILTPIRSTQILPFRHCSSPPFTRSICPLLARQRHSSR